MIKSIGKRQQTFKRCLIDTISDPYAVRNCPIRLPLMPNGKAHLEFIPFLRTLPSIDLQPPSERFLMRALNHDPHLSCLSFRFRRVSILQRRPKLNFNCLAFLSSGQSRWASWPESARYVNACMELYCDSHYMHLVHLAPQCPQLPRWSLDEETA